MKKPLLYFSCLIFNFSFCISNAQIISSIVGNGISGYSGDGGQATAAEISFTLDVQVDRSGNVYDVELFNDVVRKTTASTGIINTIAGIYHGGSYSGDGGPATAAELNEPAGVAIDTSGNIYIADEANQRVRRIDGITGIISTVAGNGILGYTGDGGPCTASEIRDPEDISTDDSGNVYIADTYNYAIRKICIKTGIITTVAGNGNAGYYGDNGPATAAEIDHTEKVRSDAMGNLYISDAGNQRIRYVPVSTGIITTVCGNGVLGFSGDGGQATAAELDYPEGIALDASGNLYIAGLYTQNIRMIDKTSGVITVFAGNGVAGFYGDGGLATAAELYNPDGLDFDKAGNLYISDSQEQHIRKVTNVSTGLPQFTSTSDITVYPIPSTGFVNLQLPGTGYTLVRVYDAFGRIAYTQNLDLNAKDKTIEMDLANIQNGIYIIQITSQKGNIGKRIVISR